MATESVVLDKRFQVGRVLGRGPSGVVHLATDLNGGSECVVKRIHPKFANRTVLDRVQSICHAAADMMHPAVLGVLYTGYEPSGSLYLVSPLVQGESLRARLSRGALSLTDTLELLEPLCSALQAAAERDLAHGSLSPTNILLPQTGGVLLSDFGMAQLRTTPGVKWDGPLHSIAPECLESGAVPATARGDVFSLGTLVYECLIGQPMFDAKSLAAYLAMVGTPPKMTIRHPSYAHLDAVLEMAASADPDARFATVNALWRALQSALLDLPASLANNLTRGMAPTANRNGSKPPQPTQSGGSKPPQPRSTERSFPPPPPRKKEPSNPPSRNVQEMPALLIEQEIEEVVAPGPPQPVGKSAGKPATASAKQPEPLPPPPDSQRGSSAARPSATSEAKAPPASAVPTVRNPAVPQPGSHAPAGRHRAVTALPAVAGAAAEQATPRPSRPDPQQILPTDPSFRLRPAPVPPSRFAAMAPLFWATVGGLVVGGSMIAVQYASRASLTAVSPSVVSVGDVDALLHQAEAESFQHNYSSAFAYADLILRVHPQHAQAKLIVEQASEQLRVSAVYGAFLRAADREQSDLAVALYRELPPGSPFRTQAWDPFMNVRNSFVRRRLAVATAALSAAQCEQIREQIEKLYFISDSATDSALQQGQRLLGKCKSEKGSEPVAVKESVKEKDDSEERVARSEKPAKATKAEKREVVASAEPTEPAKTKKRKSKADKVADKASDGGEKPKERPQEEPKEGLPSALRNPF
jgi:serine/threonine protein kinase